MEQPTGYGNVYSNMFDTATYVVCAQLFFLIMREKKKKRGWVSQRNNFSPDTTSSATATEIPNVNVNVSFKIATQLDSIAPNRLFNGERTSAIVYATMHYNATCVTMCCLQETGGRGK